MGSVAPAVPLPPDESRAAAINTVVWLGAVLATLFSAGRIYTRLKITNCAGWDDALIVLAMILNYASSCLVSVAVSYGLGRHIGYLSPSEVTNVLYYSAILQPLGIAAYCVPKLAVVILLIKLMGPTKHGVYFLYFLMVVLFISSALSFIFVFVQCNPPDHFWHPMEPATCMSPSVLKDLTIFAGSWSAFTDLVLAVFPITVFWNLQLRRSRKIAISILMGLGVIAMICAIIKTAQLPVEESADFSWNFFDLVITSFIEIDMVIICACAPVLPRLFLRLLGKDGDTSSYGGARPTEDSLGTSRVGYRQFDRSLVTQKTESSRDHLELYSVNA